MANYASLKAAIQEVIKTNGNNEITGALLQQSLLAMINALGAYYQFAGVATPGESGTNPGTPDQNILYIGGPGVYSNFSATTVGAGQIGVFLYNGQWTNVVVTVLGLINDLTTGGTDKALTAEQGKQLALQLGQFGQNFLSVTPGIVMELPSLENPHYRLDASGNFVSFANTTLRKLDVTNVSRVRIQVTGDYSLSSKRYAFYSTADESLMGSGTLVEIGENLNGPYDVTVDVPNGAVTLVVVQPYQSVPIVSLQQFKTTDALVNAIISSRKNEIIDLSVTPELHLELPALSSPHYRIDNSGNFVSFANTTLRKVDVTGISRIHIKLTDDHSITSRQYAFYSTADESLMGSGTLIEIGNTWTGSYDVTINVPENAVTLVVVQPYTNMPDVSVVIFKNTNALVNAVIDARKGEIVDLSVNPPINASMQSFMNAYINSQGEFVSFGNTTLLKLNVSGIKRLRIQADTTVSLSSKRYAFYSTADESLMGAGTLVEIGATFNSPYDITMDVPDGAVTLVVVQVYGLVPTVSILSFSTISSLVEFFVSNIEIETDADLTGRMAVNYVPAGNALAIGTKYDATRDLLLHFQPCMFNQLMTFYEIGLSSNSERFPLPNPQRNIETRLNRTTSDNIGPVAMQGGTVGGNHSLNDDGVTRTAMMESYEVFIDGERITENYSGYASIVNVRVTNILYDPTSPVVDNILTVPAIRETVLYRIERGDISVMVNHKYLQEKFVSYYCGMQSMFVSEQVLTPNGAYPDWTQYANVNSFIKQDYPNFNAFFSKDANGNQVAWLDTSYGIGNHSLINDDSYIFHKNGNKLYHYLIYRKTIPINSELNWRGVYSWHKADSETSDYINYFLKMWKRGFYYIATKQAFAGDVSITSPENIGTIVGTDVVENAIGAYVSTVAAQGVIVKVES